MSRNRARILGILLVETVLAGMCGVTAVGLRFGSEAAYVLVDEQGWTKILLSISIVQGSFYLFDLYDFSRIRQRSVLYSRTLQALGVASIVFAVLFYVLPELMIGRGVLLLSLTLMLTVMTVYRVLAMRLLGHPSMRERLLILGTDQNAINLAREVLNRREEGYEIIGFVGDDPALVGMSLINPKVVGLTSDLEELVRHHRVDRIVVAIDQRRGRLPIDSLLKLKIPDVVAIEESVSFFETLTGKVSIEMLRPSWLIFSRKSPGMKIYRRLRRLFDVAAALVGLVLSMPIMAIVALAIKLDSRGPVFYKQERVGHHNKIFNILKFRSMRADAERSGPVWAGESDSRVTRVGRIIRKLRIDELPQFVNVIRGDMSFIGPRPERPVFVEQLSREIPYYAQRHLVKPGLTGWAQIRYAYGASVADTVEKLQYDLYYIKNQSPVLDAMILFETVRIVLLGRGAR